jgi:hypothetical protein
MKNTVKNTNMENDPFISEIYWQLFKQSGNIDAFLAYRQYNNFNKKD